MPQSSPQWKSLFKHMVVEMLKKNPTKLIFLWFLYVLELQIKCSFESVDS